MGYTPPRDFWQHVYDDDGRTLRVYDVSGTTATVTGGAGSQYIEQTSTSPYVGTMAFGVIGSKAVPLLLDTGSNLKVIDSAGNTLLSTIDGRLVVIDANVANIETLVATPNQSTDRFVAVGGEFDDTSTVVVGEGQINTVRLTSQRAFHSNLRDSNGGQLGVNGSPLIVADISTVGSGLSTPISGTYVLLRNSAGNTAGFQGASTTGDSIATSAAGTHLNTAAFDYNYDVVGNAWHRSRSISGTQIITLSSGAQVIGSVVVSDGGGSLTVDGTVTANQGGTWSLSSLTSILNPVTVSGTLLQVYVPSGTVTANAGTGNFNVNLQDGAGTDITSDSFNGEQAIYTAGNFSSRSGIVLTGINALYNNTTTAARSQTIPTTGFRNVDFVAMVASSGTPTDISFYMEAVDGGNFYNMRNGFLGKFIFDDTAVAGSKFIHVTFPAPATDNMSVAVSGVGTTANLTFTVSGAKLIFST